MITFQSIELRLTEVEQKTAQMAFMNKEQLFEVLAELVAIGDVINRFIRELDILISEAETKAIAQARETKVNASMASLMVKQYTAKYKADKEWAERQANLARDLRIAALSAQRSAEN